VNRDQEKEKREGEGKRGERGQREIKTLFGCSISAPRSRRREIALRLFVAQADMSGVKPYLIQNMKRSRSVTIRKERPY
jgi:hypothetical protein